MLFGGEQQWECFSHGDSFTGGKRQAYCLSVLQPAPRQAACVSCCSLCWKAGAGVCLQQCWAVWSGNYSISLIKGETECSGRELRLSLPERED